MTSTAFRKVQEELRDFDELIMARDRICRARAGRPVRQQGASVLRGAVVPLSAAFESYVGKVFDEAVALACTGAEMERQIFSR